jgi:probable F420-dependent oxidoreductase
MELGVSLPTVGPAATPEAIARIATAAEDLGYATVWAGERFMRTLADVAFFGAPAAPMPEAYGMCFDPLETLGYVAALTDRIKLGTSVLNALLHPPIVLARRLATLDRLSGGRVVAGLGQGWVPQEFEAVNVPFDRIGDGMDETIAAMRACWGPDPVAYDGPYTRIAPSEINPKPLQAHLPVLLGAITPAGVRRAARIADGLNPMVFSKEMLLGLTAAFHTAVADAGRDPGSVTVTARANVPITDEPLGEDRPFLGGSPRQIADDLAELSGTGVDHVLFDNQAPTTVDEAIDRLEQLQKAVGRLGVTSPLG